MNIGRLVVEFHSLNKSYLKSSERVFIKTCSELDLFTLIVAILIDLWYDLLYPIKIETQSVDSE